jgi:Zinc finger, C2H2 type
MVHTELPEWPCPDCGKKFKRKFDLNRHRVTVHLGKLSRLLYRYLKTGNGYGNSVQEPVPVGVLLLSLIRYPTGSF